VRTAGSVHRSPRRAWRVFRKDKRPMELSILNTYSPLWYRKASVALMCILLQNYLILLAQKIHKMHFKYFGKNKGMVFDAC
jgi:hypothetical protein